MRTNFPRIAHVATACLLAGTFAPAHADDEPLVLKMTGFIETGASYDQLTGGYPDRHTEFVRGEIHPDAAQQIDAEIDNITEFGSTGTLFVAAYQKEIDHTWITQAGAASSDGGVTLPRLRLDLALGRKWLEAGNLVTTVGVTDVESKDGHRDHALQFSTAYYFDANGLPASIEGGIRHNNSDPGSVSAYSFYTALTVGREKQRVVSLRLAAGDESYQLVGANVILVDFPSNTEMLTWREWLGRDYGIQFRADNYHNPYYNRRGIEASFFSEF